VFGDRGSLRLGQSSKLEGPLEVTVMMISGRGELVGFGNWRGEEVVGLGNRRGEELKEVGSRPNLGKIANMRRRFGVRRGGK